MNNKNEITVKLKRRFNSKEVENFKEIANKVIDYSAKKSGSRNFMGSITQRDANSRPVAYSHERPAVFNEPVNLSSVPPPVGTTGNQQGV